ncbi:hypothetical protein TrRE_jg3629, partial [Triparma retinervis]
FDLLKASCERHAAVSRGCVMGMGFDRHLYALCQLSNEGSKVEPAGLMMKAMSDPAIMAVMANPKARPLAAKIKANPAILLEGAAAFAEEFAADPELLAMFKSIAPNVAQLVSGVSASKSVPALFKDKAFSDMMTDTLCSSMLQGDFVEVMMASPAFGDLADGGSDGEDGKRGKYFVPYSTFNEHVMFYVNGFEPEDMDGMRDAISESMELIGKLLEGGEGEMEEEEAKAAAAAAGRKRTHTVHHSTAAKAKEEMDEEEAKAARAAQGRKRTHTVHHTAAGGAANDKAMKEVMKKAMSDPEILAVMMDPKAKPIAEKIMADPSCLAGGAEGFKDEFAADPSLAVLFMGIAGKLKALMEGVEPAKGGEEAGEAGGVGADAEVVAEEASESRENIFKVGENVSSIYGEGEVEEVRDDGTVVYTLGNWELAYGSKVRCFLNPSAVSKGGS